MLRRQEVPPSPTTSAWDMVINETTLAVHACHLRATGSTCAPCPAGYFCCEYTRTGPDCYPLPQWPLRRAHRLATKMVSTPLVPRGGGGALGQMEVGEGSTCITNIQGAKPYNMPPRPLRNDPKGVGGCLGPLPALDDPHTNPHQENFSEAKKESCQRIWKFQANFRYTNFLLASDAPTQRPQG